MSRVVNLKTVRFNVFNVFDSWHTNWSDEFNYSNLLYEDLGIRSYFIGIFYRLRMPTNYVYIHRLAGGSSLLLNTDIYFYKPLRKTKLRRYFVEQRKYVNYFLKMYTYFIPTFFRNIFSNSKYKMFFYRRLSFFYRIKLPRLNNMSYISLRPHKRFFGAPISLLDSYRQSIYFSFVQNASIFFSSKLLYSKSFVLKSVSTFLSMSSSNLIRVFHLLFLRGVSVRFLSFVKLFVGAIGLRFNVFVSNIKSSVFNNRLNFSLLFQPTAFSLRSKKARALKASSSNRFSSSLLLAFHSLIRKLFFFITKYKGYYKYISLNLKLRNHMSRKRKKFFRRLKKSLNLFFSSWVLHQCKSIFLQLLHKIYTCLFLIRKTVSIRFIRRFARIIKFLSFSNIYNKCSRFYLKNNTINYFNFNSAKTSFLLFFTKIKNIHHTYYRRHRLVVTMNRKFVSKPLLYGYLTKSYINILFSYFFKHIEHTLSVYTKQSVTCLYTLFYLGGKYYPPILNAKVVCDYFIYMMHTRRSMRSSFFKVRQWQVENIKRRVSLESIYFKSQINGRPKSYIDHLSYKKYPIISIRMECSGNKKKGTMAKKVFYGNVIKDSALLQKGPNSTFSADIDYYQSFVLTKSCSIGVKVWVFFKTHLYNVHGDINTLVLY